MPERAYRRTEDLDEFWCPCGNRAPLCEGGLFYCPFCEKMGVSQPEFHDPPSIYDRPIREHGGGKYLRTIHSADGQGGPIKVDVYCVIEAFKITCPALGHALK